MIRILVPLRSEALAVRLGAPWAVVERTGMGPRRAARAARALEPAPTLVAGLCGALAPGLEAGDVIVASELRRGGASTPCPDPTLLAAALRGAGLRVHVGPIACTPSPAIGARRRALAGTGALAVDMESAWLVEAAGEAPVAVMRVVLDAPRGGLPRVDALLRALRSLHRACAALEPWARALGEREVVLAAPRASCAGVVRAVRTVEHALEQRGAPVYVRKQIVHNAHVVASLRERGAVFVEELDDVPSGSTVVFSAHGVSPAVRADARRRGLEVVDATCPLVSKVHAEARRFADAGFEIVLVGHEGHEEVEGTRGEAPSRTHVVADVGAVAQLELESPDRVACLTQTTLAVDETAEVIDALRERYPKLVRPSSDDICYATQNRQDAVRLLAQECDLILVIGSTNSSNSRRLVEVAQRAGCPALLVEDAAHLAPASLTGVSRVGVTAGASAPEPLIEDVLCALAGLGATHVSERVAAEEDIHFRAPSIGRKVG